MPEQYKAFIVVAIIAIIVTRFIQPALTSVISPVQLKSWRNIWLGATATAFLLPGFWPFIIAVAIFLHAYAKKQESSTAALYLLLMCAIPPYGLDLPGFGIINYFFNLNWLRLLSLILLFPAFLQITQNKQTPRLLATWPDKLLLSFLTLTVILQLRDTTVTDTLRQAFYAFIDVFLPYFVLSRSLRSSQQFKLAIIAFLFSATLSASLGVFEFIKHWLLYVNLTANWHIPSNGAYTNRGNSLRAYASYGGGPIVFGYGMAIALGLYAYASSFISSKNDRRNGILVLIAGLLASLSRGPWMGALLMMLIFVATGPNATQRIGRLLAFGLLAILLLPIIPDGEKFIDLLPFIGHASSDSVSYREKLFQNGWLAFQRYPLFGSINVLKTPEMLRMVQGQGIIDLVNTYLGVALFYGAVGVSLFISFFVSVLIHINRARQQPFSNPEAALLGRSLLATLAGALLIIATVSNVGVIPTLYWSLAGMGMAYSFLSRYQSA